MLVWTTLLRDEGPCSALERGDSHPAKESLDRPSTFVAARAWESMAQKSVSNDQRRATTEDPYAGPLRAQFRSGLAPTHSAIRTAEGTSRAWSAHRREDCSSTEGSRIRGRRREPSPTTHRSHQVEMMSHESPGHRTTSRIGETPPRCRAGRLDSGSARRAGRCRAPARRACRTPRTSACRTCHRSLVYTWSLPFQAFIPPSTLTI